MMMMREVIAERRDGMIMVTEMRQKTAQTHITLHTFLTTIKEIIIIELASWLGRDGEEQKMNARKK